MHRTAAALVLLSLVAMELAVFDGYCQEEIKKMALGMRKKCLAETGTTAEIIDDVEIGEFPDDRNVACYFKCILEKFNMFTKKGRLNINLLRKIVPDHFKDIGNDMIDECVDVYHEDRCTYAYDFMKCLFRANPVAFIVV